NTRTGEIHEVLGEINEQEAINLAEAIQKANRIFIAGTGRSGLVGKMVGMRLMHSGYCVYFVGVTITPSLESEDLLLLISGSGGIKSLMNYASNAKEINVTVVLVTTNNDSEIGNESDYRYRIQGAPKKRLPAEPDTIQTLGSQFV